jgi:hypothetical protein
MERLPTLQPPVFEVGQRGRISKICDELSSNAILSTTTVFARSFLYYRKQKNRYWQKSESAAYLLVNKKIMHTFYLKSSTRGCHCTCYTRLQRLALCLHQRRKWWLTLLLPIALLRDKSLLHQSLLGYAFYSTFVCMCLTCK